ncbi:hypothetical protein EPUS_06379 [Endocarpon pusillum Z07020]|uniref:DNA-directed RNA polymerase I subunit RPA34.5 domain-containing protein n=1 Tax=Endocarpon pusillum (strain Z07020 / HMAS-L-300199) TaxID=1263415 RepID=U1HU10_ENDPU|nr:uncharacterized protein EPUS_06379 [Endocarpon pusillum Z07020]ERF74110.1 hypothetical protein EPUS_06379 [Endocarpon pusillum Z07020]
MPRKKDSGKPLVLSEEYVIDSDSDGLAQPESVNSKNSSNEIGSKPSQKKQKSQGTPSSKSTVPAQRSGSESPANDGKNGVETSSSSSKAGSIETESDREGAAPAKQKLQKKRAASLPNQTPVAIPAKLFRPPNGFEELPPNALNSTTEGFEAVSGVLTGKQIWHITAPTSIPLNSIEDFDVDVVRSGRPILTYDSRQYGLAFGDKDSQHLLLPGKVGGSSYKRSRVHVSKSYHLREIPNQSQSTSSKAVQSTEDSVFFAKEQPLARPPREQPKMLRMRYKPFGTDDSPSTSTSIRENFGVKEGSSNPTLQPSSSLLESTSKRKKKHKRLHPREEDGIIDDRMQVDESPAESSVVQETPSKAEVLARKRLRDTNDVSHHRATPKEEKRKKKRAHEEPSP